VKTSGLIDLQVNGYRGVDFSGPNLDEADVMRACRELRRAGTTAFLPTLITSSPDLYQRNLPILARAIERPQCRGKVLGVHLEGPFISPRDGARGAHDRQWVRPPDLDYLKRLIDWANGTVKLITIAAELPGAEKLARWATDHGIAVSLGHQMADDEDLARLVAAGARSLTHLGNGLPASIDRHVNPIWAGLGNDDLTALIIPDGHHLPPSLLKAIIRTKSPQRCISVSDASPLAGMPPGPYDSMGAAVELEESGRIYNPATGYMAGSSATLRTCFDHLASLDLVSSEELAAMVFDNPLKLIGVHPDEIAALSDDEETNDKSEEKP